ncbi:MAG: hypothetical protein A2Y17_12190 [Clostridiales bacterium GWF2_38_85]|nr:MAG: hypothetical protein A2Y17_12190 [Clostridiales bacterium GWF2_38_85]
MKGIIFRLNGHVRAEELERIRANIKKQMQDGLVVIDSFFAKPELIEGDFAFVVEGLNGIYIMPNKLFKENVAIDQENERLRADLKKVLNERNNFADEVGELHEKACRLFNEKEELLRDKLTRQEHTIKKVERALGFPLFDWQKEYIFSGKPYGTEIVFARRAGKTLTHCLRLCLNDGEPIKAKPRCCTRDEREELIRFSGEDGATLDRLNYFVHDLHRIYNTLKDAGGIELREITF